MPRPDNDNSDPGWEYLPEDSTTCSKQWIIMSLESEALAVESSLSLLGRLPFRDFTDASAPKTHYQIAPISLKTAADLEANAQLLLAEQVISLPEHPYLLYLSPWLCRYLKAASVVLRAGFMLVSRRDHSTSHVSETYGWIFDYRSDSQVEDSAFYYAIDQGIYQGCDYWLGSEPTVYYHTLGNSSDGRPPIIPPMMEYSYRMN